MNKKLIIICEGKTEQFFCGKLLLDHFNRIYVEIEYPLIEHSKGGIVKWSLLKPQVETTLASDPACYVTTFIDFYGILAKHDFPDWDLSLAETDNKEKMSILESAMLKTVTTGLQNRFIPYIQLHEFEGLVFSDYPVFESYYTPKQANFSALQAICSGNPNPEDINDSPVTAPSKRLELSIKGYNKFSDGIDICEMIGLPKIRSKCPRFNNWITKLENI